VGVTSPCGARARRAGPAISLEVGNTRDGYPARFFTSGVTVLGPGAHPVFEPGPAREEGIPARAGGRSCQLWVSRVYAALERGARCPLYRWRLATPATGTGALFFTFD
jgi:hypothetical protein